MLSLLLATTLALAEPTVAIADLVNHTGDASLDGAGPGVAGILVSRFQQTDSVKVIEREALVRLLDEQQLSTAGLTEPATAARTGRLLGAEFLVVGELFSAKLPSISVALRVVDTETGEVVVSRDVVGEVGERGERFFTLVDQLSDDILSGIEVELSDADRQKMSSIEKRELDAVLRFGEDLLRVNDKHPMALFRETDRDFQRARYDRLRWMVYDNEGNEITMPTFSRRVGDTDKSAEWSRFIQKQQRTFKLKNWTILGYALTGVVLVGVGAQFVDPTTGETSSGGVAIQSTGFVLATLPFVHLPLNLFAQLNKRDLTRHPGAFYEPDEADRWINSYNRSLE